MATGNGNIIIDRQLRQSHSCDSYCRRRCHYLYGVRRCLDNVDPDAIYCRKHRLTWVAPPKPLI